MSFGPTAQTSSAMSQLQSNAGTAGADASRLLNLGQGTLTPATNFFNTLLNGNTAQTTSLLQPNINQIRSGTNEALQSASALMPRGGGRSGTLFGLPFTQNQQIQNLFGPMRSGAASGLAGIGGSEMGLGGSLFAPSNTAGANLGQLGQQQQQITDSLWSNLGSGIAGIASLFI